jgi:hypothetical protein
MIHTKEICEKKCFLITKFWIILLVKYDGYMVTSQIEKKPSNFNVSNSKKLKTLKKKGLL